VLVEERGPSAGRDGDLDMASSLPEVFRPEALIVVTSVTTS
jgi:hypothetical protein